MKDTIQELLKSTLTVIIIFGVILLILGASDGITVGTFSLQISDPNWKAVIGVCGLGFLVLGMYTFWRETNQTKASTLSSKNVSASTVSGSILRSISSNHKTRITITNLSQRKVNIYWIDFQGIEMLKGQLDNKEEFPQTTFTTHPWLIRDAITNKELFVLIAQNKEADRVLNFSFNDN